MILENRGKKLPINTFAGSKKNQVAPPPPAPAPHAADEEVECDLCRTNLFISMVRTETEDEVAFYCLQHGLMYLKKGELQAKESKLICNYGIDDVELLAKKLRDRIQVLRTQQQQKGSK